LENAISEHADRLESAYWAGRSHARFGGGGAGEYAIGRDHGIVDVVLVAVVFGASLFNTIIGPLTPLLLMASFPALLWLRHERLFAVVARCWPLLVLPAFAILSTLWSIAPRDTLYYGTLYLLTAWLGVFLAGALNRDKVLVGLFVAFQGYNISAILFGRMVGWGGGAFGSQAFAGLSGSKNAAGDAAALGLMIALATLTLSLERRWRMLAMVAALSVPSAAWILWSAHATGALIAGTAATFCLILWLLSRRLPVTVRGVILMTALLAVLAAVTTQSIWLQPLFDYVLHTAGKDAGLTGRSDLWHKADQLIAQRPLLGLGYNAFWRIGNLDAEALWRLMGINNRGGFNFHNTVREILVHLGFVGLAMYVIGAFTATGANFLRALRRPDPLQILACGWIVYSVMKVGFEVVGFGTMHYGTVLAFMMLALGFRAETRVAGRVQASRYGR
jgi:exopolysaccharide production protein ExoQ